MIDHLSICIGCNVLPEHAILSNESTEIDGIEIRRPRGTTKMDVGEMSFLVEFPQHWMVDRGIV